MPLIGPTSRLILSPLIGGPLFTPTLEFIGAAENTAEQTTYDFGDFTAPVDGQMIVGVAGRDVSENRSISSVSIGGTNGTIHVNPVTGPSATAIASREVSAGANNVSVTFSGAMDRRVAVWVWLRTRYSSTTPHDTDGVNINSSPGVSSVAATLNLAAKGCAVFVVVNNATGSGNIPTWTTATARDSFTATSGRHAGDLRFTADAETGHVETATWSTAINFRGISAVSWP